MANYLSSIPLTSVIFASKPILLVGPIGVELMSFPPEKTSNESSQICVFAGLQITVCKVILVAMPFM